MKLAAILVPVGFISLPTVLFVAYTLINALRGKDVSTPQYPMKTIAPRQVRLLVVLLSSVYGGIFAWSVYVLAEEPIYSAVPICAALISMVVIVLAPLPTPPESGFASEQQYRQWKNEIHDHWGETFVKSILNPRAISLIGGVLLLLLIVMGAALLTAVD